MKRLVLAVALMIGFTTVSKAQSPYQYQQPNTAKPIVRVLDSIQIAGVPINQLVIRNITISDSIVTVQSALVYSGRVASHAQLIFSDSYPITYTTNVSISSVALAIANKRGVTLH